MSPCHNRRRSEGMWSLAGRISLERDPVSPVAAKWGQAGVEEASERLVPGREKRVLVGNKPSAGRRIGTRPPLRLTMVVGF